MVLSAGNIGLAYLGAGIVSALFLVPAVRNWTKPGSKGFFLAVLGIALWSVETAGAISAVTGRQFLVTSFQIKLLAAHLAAVGWILLAVEYVDWQPLTRRLVTAVIVPIGVLELLVWTNPIHGLVLTAATTVQDGFLHPAFGPLYWGNLLVTYGLIAAGTGLMAREAIRTSGIQRRQASVLVSAVLPPIPFNLVSVFDLWVGPYDFTVFGFILSECLLAWALYADRFLQIVPVARKTIVAEMDDPVVILDESHAIVDYNAAAGKTFGLDSTVVGTAAASTFTDFDLSTITDVRADGGEIRIGDDGTSEWFDLRVTQLDDRKTTRDGLVLVFRDITKRKKTDREREAAISELERQNERLDRFASTVSHDLRNPLRIAESNLEMARHECDSELLDDVAAAHDRMDELIEDLLALARQGQTVESTEPVSVSSVATRVVEPLDDSDVTLRIKDPPTIEADRQRLQQLLENLLRNSVDHGDTSSHSAAGGAGDDVAVRVGGYEDGFYVADDGPGIPEDEREDVLEYGYTTAKGGSGFGLAIVDEIANAHGWTVTVTESKEGGARFEIATTQ